MNNKENTDKVNPQLSISDDDNGYAEFCAYLEEREAEQDDSDDLSDEPIIDRGTIVKIKPECLNPGESGEMQYVVVKVYDEKRILIQALGTGLPLAPTEAVEKSMVYPCGYAILNN